MNIIEVKDLMVTYGAVHALQHTNVSIPLGSRTAVLGPNGAGKSTLIKAILGIERIAEGQITLFNEYTPNHPDVQQKIAYVPQASQVNTQFPTTIFDIVLMGRFTYTKGLLRRPSKEDKQFALAALEKMGLADLKNRHITELSGGQKQRVFIARAIAQNAELYIMDEPLASVDIRTEQIIMDTLKEFQEQGKTSLVIHHDLHTVTKYFDYVVWLNQTAIAQGPRDVAFTQEVYQQAYQQSGTSFMDISSGKGAN
ncbi:MULTISPECIES: metal ABC transporter ATP-binding protein [unclassified Granulicatella]|uniref:metal ABC transporter ATP-binding protein n=1 Tax=unclassified Granulicatella TaxID=2630493 RepID=UPI0010736826|nr:MULTISPECIES: metal ABC transporter ATP-binding protein [unclassified Granulicatella]MBF0779815.1 metal ABC transporter ATP-binding protein [Granulicatella sp. 19428wC4_WM01]TFU96115.1 metal ABC transporter ATP-binding protein [Granulicatella sp. WM01]